jgi:HPt (histidine-containing phosphotransfer) domain-containing protein
MQPACIDVEAVDAARIATLSNVLGNQRFGELLTILSVRLQRLSAAIEMLPGDASSLVSTLHQSRGSAASLGLVGLAQALTDIEAQIARMLGRAGPLPDPARLARIKIAGRALHGYWSAASRAASRHVSSCAQDHASGICSK